ncbi:MAG: oxidoreductase [Frondihabitans sp.]|nr:oxidoreductase [Frondihabitans sp.]
MTVTLPFSTAPDVINASLSGYPSGVVALAAIRGDEPVVMIASSFTAGVSYDPPLVSVAVQRSSTTWPDLVSAPVIGISLLGEAHADKTRQLASRNRAGRLAGIAHAAHDSGAVFLDDSPTWMTCSIEHLYPAGDHEIVVLRVLALQMHAGAAPLVRGGAAWA